MCGTVNALQTRKKTRKVTLHHITQIGVKLFSGIGGHFTVLFMSSYLLSPRHDVLLPPYKDNNNTIQCMVSEKVEQRGTANENDAHMGFIFVFIFYLKTCTIKKKRRKSYFEIALRFLAWSHGLPRWPRPGSSQCGAKLVVQAGLNDSWGAAGGIWHLNRDTGECLRKSVSSLPLQTWARTL